ncbi:MAG: GerMN domain-containing protein [Bacilli bacterium]|nr:GerMN domain-containing protein [Bacilli bacterium]
MLKKLSVKKLALTTVALFAILLIYLIPGNDHKLDTISDLEYVNANVTINPIFLLDKNSYVSLSEVVLTNTQIEEKALELLNVLTVGGADSKIPSGFKAILPPDTRVLSLKYKDGLIKVDFSDDILDVSDEMEEKIVEAIVYTLTSIDDVDKIIIYVEGEILTKLPKSKINLPSTLDRSYGINKKYEFTSINDINSVTVYYVSQNNGREYYIPVTKYLNDNRDKISIVIDELTIGLNYNEKLMSFLNSDAKLVSSSIDGDTLKLEFNSSLFDDVTTKEVLEEVVYTICLSAYDNYDVENVSLIVNNEEIYKTTSKILENKKDL